MKEERKYSIEELTDIWSAFEKEWHMGPGYHLVASDVHHFLEFLNTWEDRKKHKEKRQAMRKSLGDLWKL